MRVWSQAPLVRLLLPFLLGIISAVYIPLFVANALLFASVLFIIAAAIVLIPKFYITYKKSYWFGILINLLLFMFAYELTIFNTQKFSPNHFSNYSNDLPFIHARLVDASIEKEKSIKVVVEVLSFDEGTEWKPCTGKAMIYLKRDAAALKLKYGDEILIKAAFKEVPSPQNPFEFNYKRFLAFHNIYQQVYVKEGDWQDLRTNSGNALLKYSIGLRNTLLEIFKTNHLSGDELSVGAALLLGYTDKLDADIISAYSSSGALHVLSVSGLHVAIVYLVFSWFLFFLDKNKKTRILKTILLILFLWFYAALTGLSPSVLRAATMFSFIIVAKAFNRHTNIYNTLAASAFFLLLINPYLIMEVGFQLSYLAVISIVYIQPKIQEWFEVDNWLFNQIWTITSVSIAAQIATFPLGLHYFHQFPNYFLLSNLIVIPISTAILYVGIAVFTFSHIPLFVKYLAMVFTWLIWFLNYCVKWIEGLPFSLLQGISISIFETWLLYGLIIVFLFYMSNRKFKYLMYSLIFCVAILLSQVIEQHTEFNQRKIIVYNVPKTSAIDFINSKSNVLLTDSIFAQNKSALLFHVKHNWWELGVNNNLIVSKNVTTRNLKKEENFIQFFDKKIFILKKEVAFKNPNSKRLQLDYLIVSGNNKMSLAEINKLFAVKKIIFDSSNSDYQLKKWKKECDALNQEYCSVKDSGAIELLL